MRRLVHACALGALVAVAALDAQQPQPQQPVFRASVEVTPIDVGVVDGQGKPVTTLAPSDFTVQIDGQPRRVLTADWIALATPRGTTAPAPPPGYSTNTNATGGRLILIVIDQPNIRFGGATAIRSAVNGFVDRLQPSDRVAAVGIGPGPPSTPFTTDHELIKKTIARMAGSRSPTTGATRYFVALSEAVAIEKNEPDAAQRVISRECAGERPGPSLDLCISAVLSDAHTIALTGAAEGDQTLNSLRMLLTALRTIDAPKTLVLISEGFLIGDRLVDVQDLGAFAAAARTSIYALKLERDMFSDVTTRNAPDIGVRGDDRRLVSEGIEALADASRGSLFNIAAGAEGAFARIESELSGYYLLGVESGGKDKDGKAHPIQVKVNRPGLQIRARRQFTSRPTDRPAQNPREAVMAALNSPLMLPALPLRVATFSLQGPDPTKVQLLIHAGVGADYAQSKVVTFGYTIADASGRIIESLGGDMRLAPIMNGVPSELQYTVGSSVPPGDYLLKLAIAEGDRLGTVEHPIHAALVDVPPLRLSDLMVGGPLDTRQLDRPTIGHTIVFGALQGYLEAYGAGAGDLKAQYEVAADEKSQPLLSEDVPGRPAGNQRMIFSHAIPVRQLPPGSYVLRATVFSTGGVVKTMTRGFEIAAPAVLMTSADPGAAPAAAAEIFLPVGQELFRRPFRSEDALKPDTLRILRERVAPDARAAFDGGVSAFRSRELARAESTFKKAISGDADSSASLAYLAAVYAAAGHDAEAASTWQTALVGVEDVPEIYEWLGDALMRAHELGQARTILEEAVGKWPSDLRFTKPLALLYATFGQGREAVRSLSRHLAANPGDVDALRLGVQWIYELHQAGAVSQTRAEDIKLARQYATAYEKAKGPQTTLVRQWMGILEQQKP